MYTNLFKTNACSLVISVIFKGLEIQIFQIIKLITLQILVQCFYLMHSVKVNQPSMGKPFLFIFRFIDSVRWTNTRCILLTLYLTFKELKMWRKKIYWRTRFSAIAHLQKALITASSENYLCQIKRFKCSYSKNTHY